MVRRVSREMKDSGVEWIEEIPSGWELERIKKVLIERKEMNKPTKTDFILSLTNDRGVIPYSEKGDIGNKSKEDLTSYKLAYPGDIVLNSMNAIIGSIGLSKYFGAVSPVYYMLRPRDSEDSVEYYNWVFQSKQFQENLKGYGNGIMELRMRISMNKLNTIEVPHPCSDEQIKISNFLNIKTRNIDSIVEKTKSTIEDYKLLKQSIITEAVTKGLDKNVEMKESGIEWNRHIPLHWEVINGKRLFKERKGKARVGDEQLTASQKLGILSQKEFMEKENQRVVVVEKNYSILKHVEPDDFVISMRSFQGGLEHSTVRGCISSAYVMIIPNEKVYSPYYRWLFKSRKYINALQATSNLVRDGQAMRYSNFQQVPLFLIPIKEQKVISDYLDTICPELDKLVEQKMVLINELESYKKSLIYEYVTGKKEVL